MLRGRLNINYFLFVNNISQIGGAQLYILRKSKWLLSRGFKIYIITGKKEPIKLVDFYNSSILCIPEILYPPNVFSGINRDKIIRRICGFIQDNNITYIESHQTGPALWAELVAQNFNAINIVYAIAPLSLRRKIYKEYFKKKLFRGEFLGCNKSFNKTNFPDIPTENYCDSYINIPFDASEIEIYTDCPVIKFNHIFKILTISRIDKTYIKNSIEQIAAYIKNKQSIHISYDIYTDINNKVKYKELCQLVERYTNSNLNINLFGPINPLNNCIFEDKDLFLGMGTAILNASAMKLPSLVIDYRNNKYYGFFGVDYFEFGSSEKLAENDITEYIDYLLNDKKRVKELGENGYEFFVREFDNEFVNEKFLKYMQVCKLQNPLMIPQKLMCLRDLFDFILLKIFGAKNSIKVRQYFINIMLKGKNHI